MGRDKAVAVWKALVDAKKSGKVRAIDNARTSGHNAAAFLNVYLTRRARKQCRFGVAWCLDCVHPAARATNSVKTFTSSWFVKVFTACFRPFVLGVGRRAMVC